MIILRFLKTLFGIYGMLWFLVWLVVMTLLYTIIFLTFSDKTYPRVAHALTRFWGRALRFTLFLPVKIRNRNYIDKNTTYVMVANHRSQLDIPVYAESCSNTLRFLAKAELTKIPLLGYIIKKLYITVNREARKDRNKSLEIMKASLEKNISVFLCPEGTRNRLMEPALLEFREGAFRLAVATGTPIAVLTVLNSAEHLSVQRPLELTPGMLYAVWDKPIETKGMTMNDVPALRDKVRAMMEGHLKEYRLKRRS